jgi:soluble lytic murein transglycosylase-like protein
MFDEIIADASQRWNIPVPWIQAIIETESSWNPNAYRYEAKLNDASYGLMQILGKTAVGLGFKGDVYHDLYDPQTNIEVGTADLAQLRNSYGDDFRRIYSAYNSGNPDLWQTSQQVAANVERALGNLAKWSQANPATSGLVVLLLVGLVWLLTGKGK